MYFKSQICLQVNIASENHEGKMMHVCKGHLKIVTRTIYKVTINDQRKT